MREQARIPAGPVEDFGPYFERLISEPFLGPQYRITPDSAEANTSGVMSLTSLCGLVRSHQDLWDAEVCATESYTIWTGRVIHRFLILEVRRGLESAVWLRLERQPRESIVSAMLRFGIVPSLDEVRHTV